MVTTTVEKFKNKENGIINHAKLPRNIHNEHKCYSHVALKNVSNVDPFGLLRFIRYRYEITTSYQLLLTGVQ